MVKSWDGIWSPSFPWGVSNLTVPWGGFFLLWPGVFCLLGSRERKGAESCFSTQNYTSADSPKVQEEWLRCLSGSTGLSLSPALALGKKPPPVDPKVNRFLVIETGLSRWGQI